MSQKQLPETKSYSLLLVENEPSLHSLLSENLRMAGYTVRSAYSSSDCLKMLSESGTDICIIDAATDETLTAKIRSMEYDIPIILLSEKNSTDDILKGYESGCDCYVVKPFSARILLCQIGSLLRLSRMGDESNQTQFDIDGLVFDSERQTLADTALSARESELLRLLCLKKGKLVERQYILHRLWQTDDKFAARSLAVFISHLRTHLIAAEHHRILSVHGRGYKLVDTRVEE